MLDEDVVEMAPWPSVEQSAPLARTLLVNASTQSAPSMVFDSRDDRTWRLAQSITATKKKNPRETGM